MVESFRLPVPKPSTERKTPEARSFSMSDDQLALAGDADVEIPICAEDDAVVALLQKILTCGLVGELNAFGAIC